MITDIKPYTFFTPTAVPIEAFTTFGLNAKPNSDNPLGHFGTGLKYAVAIILRMGGAIKLHVNGVEYEFYTVDNEFRGKSFKHLRMRKRRGILAKWRSEALAFTTELGKNWGLWQAYRELESNTRDENGQSGDIELNSMGEGTYITVLCQGFYEVTQVENDVFLDEKGSKVFENMFFTMYDSPSNFLYYRGVRVHDMQYPARYTYDFKKGMVKLSEDRSAMETWLLFHRLSVAIIQEVEDKGVLNKALNKSERVDQFHFEGHDLSYSSSYVPSNAFREVARKLSMRGYAPPQVSGYHRSYSASLEKKERAPTSKKVEVTLTEEEWAKVLKEIDGINGMSSIIGKIKNALWRGWCLG